VNGPYSVRYMSLGKRNVTNIKTDELLDEKNIHRPEYSQPISTALQIALVELLKSFGVVPKAVVGHSSGEIAAA
jgi:acyl transferase domain-containing protein